MLRGCDAGLFDDLDDRVVSPVLLAAAGTVGDAEKCRLHACQITDQRRQLVPTRRCTRREQFEREMDVVDVHVVDQTMARASSCGQCALLRVTSPCALSVRKRACLVLRAVLSTRSEESRVGKECV